VEWVEYWLQRNIDLLPGLSDRELLLLRLPR